MNKSAIILSVVLATGTPLDTDAKPSSSRGFSFRPSRTTPPTQSSQVPIISPKNSGTVRDTVARGTKRTLDMVAPKDDFMRYFLAMRAGVAGAQYIALTPTNLDMIAGAQYRAILDHARVLPEDHPTTQRVKRIVKRLTDAVRFDPRISHETLDRMKWEAHVIQSDIINAFCMPGGKMVIYTGIIDALRLTDDEIAVIMGHEIAHALRDHSYQRVKSQLSTNLGISTLGAITGRQMYAADIANALWQLSHSRDHEREADYDGLDIARIAGYDSCAGERVWKKMKTFSRSSSPEFLSTHPDSDERADSLREQAKRSGGKC